MLSSNQTWRGGARIGLINATWPFASLQIAQEKMILRVFILGTYVFKPEDVVAVEPYGIIPIAGKGVRIRHRVPNYPEKIIFWRLCINPQPIVDRIRQFGFGV
jgi:hypothetical protein